MNISDGSLFHVYSDIVFDPCLVLLSNKGGDRVSGERNEQGSSECNLFQSSSSVACEFEYSDSVVVDVILVSLSRWSFEFHTFTPMNVVFFQVVLTVVSK